MKKIITQKNLYASVTIASLVGLAASFMQMIEKIEILKNPDASLICNINPIFNCTNVLGAWQSSVFGFPNSLMCIMFFVSTMMLGLIGWTDSQISIKIRSAIHGFSLFFAGFGFWYLWQSTFVVGSLCIYCMFCYSAVLVINWALLRINQKDIKFNKSVSKTIDKLIKDDNDMFIWLFIAVIIIAEIILKFA